jgi:glycosyltransferase-like protein
MRPLRVAQLTYSVKPRGGVVHALALAEALARRGHAVEVMAVGPEGARFFRGPSVPWHVVPQRPLDAPFDARIAGSIDDFREGLRTLLAGGRFDVVHAQDCISANAALGLREEGVIGEVVRTVHHVDDFRSPSLVACQRRSIVEPDLVLCVSAPWVARLREEFGVGAGLVRNGVDTARFWPPAPGERRRARAALGLGERLTLLTVGGVEPRKGSLTLLEAFARVRAALPGRDPVLLVAGGATLFDYRDELERFARRRAALGLEDDVRLLGPVDDERLLALYHGADVFALPSTKEGFGLVVLEALACGRPVVVSALDVFASFLRDGSDALMAPVGDAPALAGVIVRAATDAALRARLRDGGRAVVARHDWDAAAAAHERAYAALAPAEAA